MICQSCGSEINAFTSELPLAGICDVCLLLERYGSRFEEAVLAEGRESVIEELARRLEVKRKGRGIEALKREVIWVKRERDAL